MRTLFKKIVFGVSFLTMISFLNVSVAAKDKDKTPPVISNVLVASVSRDSATITWTTDEPADSDIDYGIDSRLNQHGPADTTLVTSHSILLVGLLENSTYSYCVISRDEANNRTRECGFTFTTNAPPPDVTPPAISVIGVNTITVSSAIVTWTTDEIANSQIEYGTTDAYGSFTPLDETLNINHTVILSGLAINTLYHLKILTSDGSGNKTVSSDVQFSTLSDSSGGHTTPPIISAVSPHEINNNSIHVSWVTDELSDSQIEYGVSTDYGSMTLFDATLLISHEQFLLNLLPDTAYHLRILSRDSAGNLSVSNDYTFTTLGSFADVAAGGPGGGGGPVAPTITDVTVNDIKLRTVNIVWNTDMPTTSQVDYGFDSTYKESTNKDTTLVLNHKQTLHGLIPNTEYHFRVASGDGVGDVSYSIDATFKTLNASFDKESPTPIDDLAISDVQKTSFTLSWTAPEDDTGVVFYDVNLSDTMLNEDNFYNPDIVHETVITVEDVEEHGKDHSYKVIGLNPGKTVYLAIKSQDSFKNVSFISNVVSTTLLSSSGVNDKQPPKKVGHVQAMGLDKLIVLSWQNPNDPDFAGVHIMRSLGQYPSHPGMGDIVYDGKGTTFSDPYLENGKTYYYSIFTYDTALNYSEPIQFSLAPYAERRHYHVLSVGGNNTVSLSQLTEDLVFGQTNDQIGHLQELLATDPSLYPEGLITGYFGPKTRTAVKRLQYKYNLPETGVVDAAVRNILKGFSSSQTLLENSAKNTVKSIANDLYFNMRKDEVKVLQGYLEKQGFLKKGFVTGYFGLLTKQAVINFQKSNNITPAGGYVGPVTRSKILENAGDFADLSASSTQVVADNLQVPWAIAFLPNGDILATERSGNLAIIKEGNVKRIPVDGVYSIAEGGLLGMALHPDFDKNHFVYLYMTYQEDGKPKNRVERYVFTDSALSDRKNIIDSIPGSPIHNGGGIAFGPDGYLYIATGYADNDAFAQDTNSLAGKILRISDEGVAPKDNPFENLIYAYGFRNPQGLAWDDSGNLWVTDHGRSGLLSGFDEVNLVEKGKNYGWPIVQENQPMLNTELSAINSGPDETWAPGGLTFVDGSLFFGGLRGSALYQAQLVGKKVVGLKKYFTNQFGRIRAVAKDQNGDIYFTTSNTDGRGNPTTDDDKLIKIKKFKLK